MDGGPSRVKEDLGAKMERIALIAFASVFFVGAFGLFVASRGDAPWVMLVGLLWVCAILATGFGGGRGASWGTGGKGARSASPRVSGYLLGVLLSAPICGMGCGVFGCVAWVIWQAATGGRENGASDGFPDVSFLYGGMAGFALGTVAVLAGGVSVLFEGPRDPEQIAHQAPATGTDKAS